MDEALRQVAKDAQVGHWAPHLGLVSDAERIQYLAEWLDKVLEQLNDRTNCEHCDFCPNHE
jgi:hypothetical protein